MSIMSIIPRMYTSFACPICPCYFSPLSFLGHQLPQFCYGEGYSCPCRPSRCFRAFPSVFENLGMHYIRVQCVVQAKLAVRFQFGVK
ncbi:hypothetical protein PISMIDRAFT_599875 [Pisolithus microcarpus 441]|uniref:Uncharacterized protein n=1 Tax=Pisolithus microcarpus 441 TaxID=765257 RepID=A0A0C9ZJN4_9AGAM|nr:hypothetical protein PISMIDRAFT_599875 [Pisolithus microcarpus 441]